MNLLIRTPSPHPNESLLGYTLRVSEANGYETPWHILSLAGFKQNEMKSAGFNIDKLAAILGKDRNELTPLGYQSDEGEAQFQLLGQSIGGSLTYRPLRLKTPALCPHCVADAGYIDAFWDLSIATACPTHGIQAISRCPSCKESLSWFRPGRLQCKCSASLYTEQSNPASLAEINLMKIVYAKLHCREKPADLCSGLPVTALWALSLRSLLELIIALGKHSLSARGEPTDLQEDRVRAAVVTLSDWPNNFYAFLHNLDKQSNGQSISLRKNFEEFYSSMFKNRHSAQEYGFLKEEMIRFGCNAWGSGIVDHRMLGDMNNIPRFMSQEMIARHLGVHQKTVKNWAKNGLIPIKGVSTASQSRFVVDSQGLTAPISMPGKVLMDREAAKRVGLPVRVLNYLKTSGHFESRYRVRFKGGYHEKDVDNFCALLQSRTESVSVLLTDPTVTLDYVMQEIRFWSKTGKGEFLAAYIDGKIQGYGSLDGTFGSTLLLQSDIEKFAKEGRTRASGGAISLQEAGDILGCDIQSVSILAANGFLESRQGPDRVRVTAESVLDLSSKYATATGISREQNSTTVRIKRLIKEYKIDAIRISRDTGNEVILVSVEDKAVLLEHLAQEKAKSRTPAADTLMQYLETIARNGERLPRRVTEPNLVAIANACGFDRSAFYTNAEVIAILRKFDLEERARLNISARLAPVQALKAYLTGLKQTGRAIPLWASKPNLKAIATECGFERNLFYENQELIALLTDSL